MKKRFLDADINLKPWFRKLSAQEKVLWYHITTACTFDGFFEECKDSFSFYCNGYKGDIPEIIIAKLGMIKIDEDQYFLKNWVTFQYGELKPHVNTHKSAIKRIISKGLGEHFPELSEYRLKEAKEKYDEKKAKEKHHEKESKENHDEKKAKEKHYTRTELEESKVEKQSLPKRLSAGLNMKDFF